MSFGKWLVLIFVLALLIGCRSPAKEIEGPEQEVVQETPKEVVQRIAATQQEKQQITERCSRFPDFEKCYDAVLEEYEKTKSIGLLVKQRNITTQIVYGLIKENEVLR